MTESVFLNDGGENPDGSAINDTLVLFVHGIFGDTLSTWKREGGTSLPALLLKTKGFEKGYDTFAFGFESSMIKSGSLNIPEAGKVLRSKWIYYRFGEKYKHVIIVAHSMGGLVALSALNLYPDMRAKVPLIVAYATPFDGRPIPKLLEKVIENPGLTGMQPAETNQFTQSLSDSWKQNKGASQIVCAYETVDIPGIGLVVPKSSAQALCDEPATPIAADHISIVKPTSLTHGSS